MQLRALLLALLSAVALASGPVNRAHASAEGQQLAAKLLQDAAVKFAAEHPEAPSARARQLKVRAARKTRSARAPSLDSRRLSPQEEPHLTHSAHLLDKVEGAKRAAELLHKYGAADRRH